MRQVLKLLYEPQLEIASTQSIIILTKNNNNKTQENNKGGRRPAHRDEPLIQHERVPLPFLSDSAEPKANQPYRHQFEQHQQTRFPGTTRDNGSPMATLFR